jgi:hypothetical protein
VTTAAPVREGPTTTATSALFSLPACPACRRVLPETAADGLPRLLVVALSEADGLSGSSLARQVRRRKSDVLAGLADLNKAGLVLREPAGRRGYRWRLRGTDSEPVVAGRQPADDGSPAEPALASERAVEGLGDVLAALVLRGGWGGRLAVAAGLLTFAAVFVGAVEEALTARPLTNGRRLEGVA